MAHHNPRKFIQTIGNWAQMRADFRWDLPQYLNISEACCDVWARVEPDRVAIVHVDSGGEPHRWTYGQLKDASDRFANVLAARGVKRGDRVAVLLPQSPEVLITHFAAMKLGAVGLPLFTLFGPEALQFRLSDSGARAVVSDAANIDKVMSVSGELPEMEALFSIDEYVAPVRGFWADIKAGSPQIEPVKTTPDDPAILAYTSGTTGPPKGVLYGHRFLLGHLPSVECHHEGFPQPGDIGWTPADWAWIGGLMNLTMPSLFHGVPMVSHRMRKFDPDAAYALIKQHRVRNMFLPPTALKLMRQAPVAKGIDIRSVSSGGESLGAELLAWGRENLRAPINEIYGQTECNLVLSSCAGSMEVRPGSMGQAVPGFDIAIIDDKGAKPADGEVGEIAVKAPSPAMFLRYLNRPGATRDKFVNGWLRTGDLGSRDADGYFTFSSRDDDIITSAEYRIGPTEIENCLGAHPDVTMAAAIGVPDELRGEVVKAFVVLREGAEWAGLEEQLIQKVRVQVSPHVAPKLIEKVDELPMTATGKIMRRMLRD